MQCTQSEHIAKEKSLLVDYVGHTLDFIYNLITPRHFKYGEMGGYVNIQNQLIHPVSQYAKYDYKVDKPYYNFDFRAVEFKNEDVLWHLHPFQNEDVHNSYPSYEDLSTALRRPAKLFMLITKLGTFLYKSAYLKPRNLDLAFYQAFLFPWFAQHRNLANLNDVQFQHIITGAVGFTFVPKNKDVWKHIDTSRGTVGLVARYPVFDPFLMYIPSTSSETETRS